MRMLDGTICLPITAIAQPEVVSVSTVEGVVARPLKCISPRALTKLVENVVNITGVDQHRDILGQNCLDVAIDGLNIVTCSMESLVHAVAAERPALDLYPKSLHGIGLTQKFRHIVDALVAHVGKAADALLAHIVWV